MVQTQMTDDLLNHTQQIKQVINRSLSSVRLTQFEFSQDLINSLFPMVTAGKLMRGNIVCHLAEIFQPRINQALIIQVAAGIELIGSGILIQDDVMDDDRMRRGLPSIHTDWTQKIKKQQWVLPKHNGQSIAICLSDTCLFAGMHLIGTAPSTSQLCQKMINLAASEMVSLSQVQAIELTLALQNSMPDLSEIEELYIGKTGNYSVAWPLVTGAILTDQSDLTQKKLRRIGQQIGLIFQIQDDWLGIYGDTKITGKSNTSDIKNKRKTWILGQLAVFQNQKYQDLVNRFIAMKDHSLDPKIMALLHQPAFQQYLKKVIKKREQKVKSVIIESDLTSAVSQFLNSLLKFAVNRKK